MKKKKWEKWCPKCAHWCPLGDGVNNVHGECRRYAPKPKRHEDCKCKNTSDESDDGCLAVFPVTSFDQWCGEFKEKDA